jgi:putative thioredoxin
MGMADTANVVEVGDHNFETEVLQQSLQRPVLVDFWASWCAPCKALTPVLEKLAADYGGAFVLAKINSDEQQQLAMQCGIRSLPTVMLIKDGQIADGFVGAQPESAIRALLEKHAIQPLASLEQPEVSVSERLGGDRLQAIAALKAMLAEQPGDEAAILELSGLLIAEGSFSEAGQWMATLGGEKAGSTQAQGLQAALRLAAQLEGVPADEVLRARVETNARDSEAHYGLALREVLRGEAEAGLERLLGIVTRDRKYGDDAARKAMVEVFAMLGGSGPLVKQYRSRLYSAMN